MLKGIWRRVSRSQAEAFVCGFLVTIIVTFPFMGGSCPLAVRSVVFHGGDPNSNDGSCVCGRDGYCLCTPSLAVDAVIEVSSGVGSDEPRFVLVERRVPPANTFAIPGGFVEIGEAVGTAIEREVVEETALSIRPGQCRQWRVYSDPSRDKRRHTVSAVHRCVVTSDQVAHLHGGDDAKAAVVVPAGKLSELPFGFDHAQILRDYMAQFHSE